MKMPSSFKSRRLDVWVFNVKFWEEVKFCSFVMLSVFFKITIYVFYSRTILRLSLILLYKYFFFLQNFGQPRRERGSNLRRRLRLFSKHFFGRKSHKMGGAGPRGRRSYDERHPDDAAEGDLLYGWERDAGKAGNLERNFGEEHSYSANWLGLETCDFVVLCEINGQNFSNLYLKWTQPTVSLFI